MDQASNIYIANRKFCNPTAKKKMIKKKKQLDKKNVTTQKVTNNHFQLGSSTHTENRRAARNTSKFI